MGNWDAKDLPLAVGTGEWRCVVFDPNSDVPANEALMSIPQERTGKQSCLGEDLEAIAYAKDQSTSVSEGTHSTHDGGKPRNCTAPKVVAIGKPSGQDDAIKASGQCSVLVPKELRCDTCDEPSSVVRVTIAVGAREDYNANVHGVIGSIVAIA